MYLKLNFGIGYVNLKLGIVSNGDSSNVIQS